jgi:hypothetical protein
VLVLAAIVACGSPSEPSSGPANVPKGPVNRQNGPADGPNGPASGPSGPSTIAFVDATVIAMDRPGAQPHQTVLVRGDAIVALGPVDRVDVPRDAMRVDARGKFLVPGLHDMHVHLDHTRGMMALFVEHGVTMVRNMAGNPRTVALRERVARGEVLGPTIRTAGPFVDGERPRWEGSFVVTKPAEAEPAIAAHVAAGYDYVKVYNGLALDSYDALAASARAHGLKLVGHVPSRVPLEHALAAQASIEHLTGYIGAIERRDSPVRGGRNDASLIKRWMYADPARMTAMAEATARANAYNCPTLVTAFAYADLWRDRTPQADLDGVSPMWRARWDPKKSPWGPTKPGVRRAMEVAHDKRLANQLALVRELVAAGAPVLAGTDTPNSYVVPGESLHQELARFVEAGLTPYEALRTATIVPAEFLGDPRDGRIAVGARADLVLIASDPLADIRALDRIDGVVLRGRWLPAAELRELRAKQVATYDAPPWLAPPALADRAPGARAIEFVVSENGAPIGAYTMAKVDRDLVERETLEDDTITTRLSIGADRRVHKIEIDVERVDSALHASHVRGPGDRPLVGALTPATGVALASSVALEVDQHVSLAVDALDVDAPGTLQRGELSITRLPASGGQRAYAFRLAIARTATAARIVIDGDQRPRFFKVSSTTRPLIRTWERR